MTRRLGRVRPRTRWAWLLAAAAALTAPSPAAAQRAGATVDLSGVRLRYADSVDATAASLGSGLNLVWPRFRADLAGSFSRFDGGDWAVQGSVIGALLIPATSWLAGEAGGWTGGSAHRDGTSTGQALATVRAHFLARGAGLWLGGGLGGVRSDDTGNRVRHWEAGGWLRRGGASVVASVSPTRVGDDVRYTDTQLFAVWTSPRVELSGTAGHRSGGEAPSTGGGSETWGNASASLWVAPRAAVVVSGGTYPVDLTQGFPGGRYVSLGLKLATRRQTVEPGWAGRPARAREPAGPAVTAFRVNAAPAGEREIRVRSPGAARVELSGDFTRWEPVALTAAANGWWTARLRIAPGTYQVSVRVNGVRWIAPPGLVEVTDEFGGSAGILVIEGRPL